MGKDGIKKSLNQWFATEWADPPYNSDPLIDRAVAMRCYGATRADMKRVPGGVERRHGWMMKLVYPRSAIEATLIERYGSLAECRARAEFRRN